jgi:rhamnogalacturonyl hydrolase YesR
MGITLKLITKTIIIFSIISLLSFCTNNDEKISSSTKPLQEDVLQAMKTANDYFMNKFPDPSKDLIQPPHGRVWKSNIWTFGTYAVGLMDFYNTTKDTSLLNYITDWAVKHDWKISTKEMWNDHLAGQTYIQLYELNNDYKDSYTEVKRSIDVFMKSGDIENRVFGDNWNWIDAAFMAMPLFAQLGNLTGDQAYYDKMHELYLNMKNEVGGGLYNPEDGLWWRDSTFKPPYTEPNGEDCYWSRGNGWIVGALVRSLNFLPENNPNRDEYKNILKQMCTSLLEVQREDGLWNVSLHDPNNYGGKEVTGSSFFLYGMAWGVNNGLLDAEKFTPTIYKGWNTLVNDCLHPNGFLGYVQSTGDEPATGQPVTYDSIPDFEDYGLGAFLLAGSEVYKLVN